jgi:acid stress-induced BolA-like protein IbaG/YrbA
MPGFLVDELKEYVAMLYDPKPDDRIFKITKSNLSKVFHNLSEEAGLDRITVHGLRHSHVSLLINKKYDIFEVSKRIGHKSIKTTQDIYGHLFDEVQRTIANDLDYMSEKRVDNHNRFRSLTVAFRASPEENEQINVAVSLSGLSKQDYIISKLLDRTIHVQGNCKVHRAVYDRLSEVLAELQRIQSGDQVNDELLDNISLITNLVDHLYIKTNL